MKSIDIKSLLIGALLCSTVLLATGWQNALSNLPQRWLTTTTDSENRINSPYDADGYEPFDSLLDKNGKIKIVWRKKIQ